MPNYERLWFKLKKHMVVEKKNDFLEVMAALEIEEYEAEPTPVQQVLQRPIDFIQIEHLRPKYGIGAPAPSVTMYAVSSPDIDPLTGYPAGWRSGASSVITSTDMKIKEEKS